MTFGDPFKANLTCQPAIVVFANHQSQSSYGIAKMSSSLQGIIEKNEVKLSLHDLPRNHIFSVWVDGAVVGYTLSLRTRYCNYVAEPSFQRRVEQVPTIKSPKESPMPFYIRQSNRKIQIWLTNAGMPASLQPSIISWLPARFEVIKTTSAFQDMYASFISFITSGRPPCDTDEIRTKMIFRNNMYLVVLNPRVDTDWDPTCYE